VGGGGTLLQEYPVIQLYPELLTIPPPPQVLTAVKAAGALPAARTHDRCLIESCLLSVE